MKLLSLFAVVAILAGCGREAAPPPPDIRPVRAEQVASTRTNNPGHYAGEIRARYETALAFRVSGRVSARLVEVGTQVRAGQAIATLDPQDYALAVRAVKAQLTAAEAESQLAQQDLQRFTELRAQNFIAQAQSTGLYPADRAACRGGDGAYLRNRASGGGRATAGAAGAQR